MSRPKFRAWDKVYKHMITDEQDFIPLMITNKGVFRLSPHHSENLWEMMGAERFELMQYTGLTDRNGKEIYEGDVLKVPDLYETPENTSTTYHNELIDFAEGTFRLDGRPIADGYDYIQDECEVIGSVYTHPHLMEVSNT